MADETSPKKREKMVIKDIESVSWDLMDERTIYLQLDGLGGLRPALLLFLWRWAQEGHPPRTYHVTIEGEDWANPWQSLLCLGRRVEGPVRAVPLGSRWLLYPEAGRWHLLEPAPIPSEKPTAHYVQTDLEPPPANSILWYRWEEMSRPNLTPSPIA